MTPGPAPFQHVFDDRGDLVWNVPDRAVLAALATALGPVDRERLSLDRTRCMNLASSIIQDHNIHSSLAGLGGCTDVATWRKETPDDPVEAALKELFLAFVDAGFVPREFLLATWDAVCEIQVTMLLTGKV